MAKLLKSPQVSEIQNVEKSFFIVYHKEYIKSFQFLSSSVVERSTVNRVVIGSNPIWGGKEQ